MTIGWKFNKGLLEAQNSRLTTTTGGSVNGIFPHSQDSHRGFTNKEDSPNLFFGLQLNLVSSGCDGNLQHPLQPSYPSEALPSSFSSPFRSSLRPGKEATCVPPAPWKSPIFLIDFHFLVIHGYAYPCAQPTTLLVFNL